MDVTDNTDEVQERFLSVFIRVIRGWLFRDACG
jgi:hypothetical protein